MQASLESMVVGNGNGVTQQFNSIAMPENQGWPQAYAQQQSPSLDQQGSSSMYLMNMIKPDHGHHTPQRPTLSPSPLLTNNTNMLQQSPHQQHPQSPASVITATYNPTYNRCLPKILSDLDCEMKIKQVLKCIENILLDGNELDQQQSYKLPDRSSSPQAPKKKIKVKEDEELLMMAQAANQNTSANMILSNSNNKVATGASKSPVRINLKVEPSETEKAQRGNNLIFQSLQPDQQHQQVPSASPRSQPFDFNMVANRQHPQQNSFPKQPPQQQQQQQQQQNSPRPFSFDPYSYAGNPAAQQFIQQAYLQQMHPQFFLQQQQHLQAVQQLQAQQQQMMNNGVHVQPHMQFTLNQAVSAILQQNNGAHNTTNNNPNNNANAQPQESNPQQQQPDTYNVHMEDYHFPVFNAAAPQDGGKEEGKKQAQAQGQNQGQTQGQGQGQGQGEDEQLYFFGSSNNPNSSSGLLYPPGTQPPNNGEQGDATQGEQGKSGLGISSLLLAPGTNGAHMALWGSGIPLNGVPLEEDDKWIYSLLNMETVPHETNPTNAF